MHFFVCEMSASLWTCLRRGCTAVQFIATGEMAGCSNLRHGLHPPFYQPCIFEISFLQPQARRFGEVLREQSSGLGFTWGHAVELAHSPIWSWSHTGMTIFERRRSPTTLLTYNVVLSSLPTQLNHSQLGSPSPSSPHDQLGQRS